jgi:type II secretory pathway component PulF
MLAVGRDFWQHEIMRHAEKAGLFRELAKLVKADFHLDRALQMLLGQKAGPGRRAWLEALQRGLAEGLGIAESLRVHGQGVADGLEVALLAAGERCGRLAPALEHLAGYHAAAAEAAAKTRGALVYPVLLLHVAILLPEIPIALRAETGMAGFGAAVLLRLGLLWGGLLALGVLWRWASRRAVRQAGWDRVLGRLPLLGAPRRHWALARFCQVFHAGLLAALRPSDCCRLAGEAAQSGCMLAGAEVAAKRVEAGEALTEALAVSTAFDPAFVNAVATAEVAGGLDDEMRRWAQAESLRATEAVERVAVWLPRAGYALVVVYVVWRIIGLMLGYFAEFSRLLEG